jgi:hypothetical protein
MIDAGDVHGSHPLDELFYRLTLVEGDREVDAVVPADDRLPVRASAEELDTFELYSTLGELSGREGHVVVGTREIFWVHDITSLLKAPVL